MTSWETTSFSRSTLLCVVSSLQPQDKCYQHLTLLGSFMFNVSVFLDVRFLFTWLHSAVGTVTLHHNPHHTPHRSSRIHRECVSVTIGHSICNLLGTSMVPTIDQCTHVLIMASACNYHGLLFHSSIYFTFHWSYIFMWLIQHPLVVTTDHMLLLTTGCWNEWNNETDQKFELALRYSVP